MTLKTFALFCLLGCSACKEVKTQGMRTNTNLPVLASPVWTFVSKDSLPQQSQFASSLQGYQLLYLNTNAWLKSLPKGSSGGKAKVATVVLPLPDSTFMYFEVAESVVMEPALAEKFPEIKTYAGTAINQPAGSVRMEITPKGFFAMISIAHQTSYVQPAGSATSPFYLSYYKTAVKPDRKIPFELRAPAKN
jgi:hypothetical protein